MHVCPECNRGCNCLDGEAGIENCGHILTPECEDDPDIRPLTNAELEQVMNHELGCKCNLCQRWDGEFLAGALVEDAPQ